jgi:hypothetical protein
MHGHMKVEFILFIGIVGTTKLERQLFFLIKNQEKSTLLN